MKPNVAVEIHLIRSRHQRNSDLDLAYDLRIGTGGYGDVWMTLLALFSASKMLNTRFHVNVATDLADAAATVFGERLLITTKEVPSWIFTWRGARQLLPDMIKGSRFVMPFYRIIRNDRNSFLLREYLNDVTINLLVRKGWLQVPLAGTEKWYIGHAAISWLLHQNNIGKLEFYAQASLDLKIIQGITGRLISPRRHAYNIAVFPSVSTHQYMPVWWATKTLPNATFFFHIHDRTFTEYKLANLNVERFESPYDVLQIARSSKQIIATDSFPWHLVQCVVCNAMIILTQQPRSRVVHPGFEGAVVQSEMDCCPCINRSRETNCASGRKECGSWMSNAIEVVTWLN